MRKNFPFYKLLIALVLLSFPFIGSDCNNTTTQVTNDNIQGSWMLVQNTGGSQHDVCPGETADFQSNGVAVLTCPNQNPINRNYTVTNGVLKFTDTQVEYNVNLTNNNNTLNMTGIGSVSGRILAYNKIISGNETTDKPSNPSQNKNSSER
jgi:hypothetical protein